MDGIILAAGKGSRLGSITKTIPKCMVKLAGKPLIGWVYDTLLQSGIDNIYVIAGYKKDIVGEFIHRRYDDAHMVIQNHLNGTADALTHVDENKLSDSFLVLASDAIYSYEDIKELMKKPNSLLYTEQEEDLQFKMSNLEDEVDSVWRKRGNVAELLYKVNDLIKNQKDIDPEYVKIINKEFWNII